VAIDLLPEPNLREGCPTLVATNPRPFKVIRVSWLVRAKANGRASIQPFDSLLIVEPVTAAAAASVERLG
jgi:hypothetical protein